MTDALQLIATINRTVDPMGVMRRITERTLDLIEPSKGVMIGLRDEEDCVTYVIGAGTQAALVGTRVQLGSSLSGLAVQTSSTQRADDTEVDPRVDLEACRRHGVRSLVCVPLLRDELPIGVMAVNCPEPHAFDDGHVETLARLARFVGVAIGSAQELHDVSTKLIELAHAAGADPQDRGARAGAATRYMVSVLNPDSAERLASSERIHHVLDDPDLLSIVFQPVVDVHDGRVIALEALSRFELAPQRPPDEWFAEAHGCGLGLDLELLAVRKALALLPDLPDDVAMTVNVGPMVAATTGFGEVFADVARDRVILEVTEHAVVNDYPLLVGSLWDLRRSGVRVAIDDTGSGYSSLAHILKIAPDFIKLDRELTSGIDIDPVRRALAAALVAFAADTGAEIVAEGAETAEELAELERLGVRYAQGFHLGRPAPLSTWTTTPRRRPAT